MVHHKPSGKGQKVTLGENAPTYQESTGKVPKDSLAAESVEHSGEFSHNRGVESVSSSKQEKPASSSSSKHESSKQEAAPRSKPEKSPSSKKENPPSAGSESYAQAAAAPPPKAAAEYHGESAQPSAGGHHPHHRRDSWPHGRNITEGIDYKGTEDGMQKAMNAELGSEDDPSRLAELRFQKQNELRAAGDTGPRQYETVGNSQFDALDEQQA